MLTDARGADARAKIEAASRDVFAFEDVVAPTVRGLAGHAGTGSWVEMTETTAMASLERLYAEAERTWVARRSIEECLGVINEDDLRALDVATGVARSCLRLLEDQHRKPLPHDVAYVIATLGVRAQATCHEISALLRAGFPNGAAARWRTLHEVAVVSRVLMWGNRYTAARFVNHRWVMAARDRDHLSPPPDWPGPTSPEVMRKRFVRRYGPAFSGKYGWAAKVTLRMVGVEKPQWHHLETVARLAEGHRPRITQAHHAVHVDSLGGLRMLDASGTLHAGASVTGTHAIVWQTVHALAESVDSLIAMRLRYDASPIATACRAYANRMLGELEFDLARVPSP